MTFKVELLPLPLPSSDYPYAYDGDDMKNYAHANVGHTTARLQAEVEALRAEVDVLKAENKRLRDALEEIRNRSSIGVMRSDQSELEVVLADICLFVDAVTWKEKDND